MLLPSIRDGRRVPRAGRARPLPSLTAGVLLGFAACGDDPTAPEPSGPAAKILAQRPVATAKRHMTTAYSEPAPSLPEVPLTELESRTLLTRYADANPVVDTQRALELFESAALRSIIPEPGLRALYAGLAGMPFGDRTLEFVLTARTPAGLPKVRRIEYGTVRAGLLAEVWFLDAASGQMTIRFSTGVSGENPMLLAGLAVHEVLHQDLCVSPCVLGDRYEETVAHAIQTLVTLAQMVHTPGLFDTRTRLTQTNMSYALGLFGTGLGPRLGLRQSNGNALLFPGTSAPFFQEVRAFTHMLRHTGELSSPGGPFLQSLLDELARRSGTASCSGAVYNQALVACLDRLIGDVSLAADAVSNPWSVEKRAGPMAETLGLREALLAKAQATTTTSIAALR